MKSNKKVDLIKIDLFFCDYLFKFIHFQNEYNHHQNWNLFNLIFNLLADTWLLGQYVCDLYLSLDYTVSNASVANLILISFDRYFSITRPLTYRVNRTTLKVKCFIAFSWFVSIFIWVPLIIWPYIDTSKKRNNDNECKVQFLYEDKFLTLLTASIAFYIPVIIIITLYYKIWVATKKRNIELKKLQAEEQYASMSASVSINKINTKNTNNTNTTNNNNNNNNADDNEESDEMVPKVLTKKKRNEFRLKKFLFNLVDKEDEIEPNTLTQTNPTSNTNEIIHSSVSIESNLNAINNNNKKTIQAAHAIGESRSSNEDDVWQMRTACKRFDNRLSDFGLKTSDSFLNKTLNPNDKPKKSKSYNIFYSILRLNKTKKKQDVFSSNNRNNKNLDGSNESKIDPKNKSNTSINTNNTLNNSINKKVSSLCKYCQTRKVIMQLEEFSQAKKDINNNNNSNIKDNNDTISKSSLSSNNKVKSLTSDNTVSQTNMIECKICKKKLLTINSSKSSNDIYSKDKIVKIDDNLNNENKINKSQLNVNDLNDTNSNNTTKNQISKSNSCNLIYSNDNKQKNNNKMLNEPLNYNKKLLSESNLKIKQTNNYSQNNNNNTANNNFINNNINNKKIVTKKLEKKNDQKAAKTLSAILLAFIITWTPYNVSVVVNTFCNNCLDKYIMWQHFG